MPRRLPALIAPALLVLALATAACGADRGSGSNPGTDGTALATTGTAFTPGTGVLSYPVYADPETPIVAGVGKRFAIVLEASPQAGTRWITEKAPDPAVVRPLGEQFASAGPDAAPDTDLQVINFVATGEGTTKITLRSGRPGAPDPADPTATFTVTVTLTGEPPTTEPPSSVAPSSPPPSYYPQPSTTQARPTTTTTRPTTTTTRGR